MEGLNKWMIPASECIQVWRLLAHLTCGSGLGPGDPSLALSPLVENVV